MKKLAITSIAVLIALCGFIAILYFLPGNCCGEKHGCEMRDAKCSGEHDAKSSCSEAPGDKCSSEEKDCKHEGKCGDKKESCKAHGNHSCEMGEMESGHGCEMKDGPNGCKTGNERRIVKEWTDKDGKVHREVKVMINGDGKGDAHMSCPMEMGAHSGCCCCCMMMHGGMNSCGHGMDSMEADTVRMKVRGKL
jgi:hypothetical protein